VHAPPVVAAVLFSPPEPFSLSIGTARPIPHRLPERLFVVLMSAETQLERMAPWWNDQTRVSSAFVTLPHAGRRAGRGRGKYTVSGRWGCWPEGQERRDPSASLVTRPTGGAVWRSVTVGTIIQTGSRAVFSAKCVLPAATAVWGSHCWLGASANRNEHRYGERGLAETRGLSAARGPPVRDSIPWPMLLRGSSSSLAVAFSRARWPAAGGGLLVHGFGILMGRPGGGCVDSGV